MKVTALIPDALVEDIKKLSKGKNITESLVIALQEWRDLQKLKIVSKKLGKNALKFSPNFTAEGVRSLNRK
jgi:hypothetical protein